MAKTYLDYLTLPNPITTQKKSQKGSRTPSKVVYGPDDTRPWEDVTWENLEAAFEDVLRKPMARKPLIKNATEVPSEKLEIMEEESVTTLAVAWQEFVLRHTLEGTHKILSKAEPDGPFGKGTIHFQRNAGRGHIKSRKGTDQRPDWCAYQNVPGAGPVFPNLVPGDSKPASKWKSEWIKNADPILRSKADEVMWQVTRYMWDAKTRYSFILTEDELVPVRISVVFKDMDLVPEPIENVSRAEQIVTSDGNFEGTDEDDDNHGSRTRSEAHPDASWGSDTRKTGIMLEWCRIPWSASGKNILTINLTLWWLLIMAVQDTSIKRLNTYTPLSERIRGHSPVLSLQQIEEELTEIYGEPKTPRKRRADDDHGSEDDTPRSSKIQKGGTAPGTSFSSSYPRTRASTSRNSPPGSGETLAGEVTPDPSVASFHASSRRRKHPRQRMPSPESESSFEDMSQMPNSIFNSFSSHV